jgi:hypothetical protein
MRSPLTLFFLNALMLTSINVKAQIRPDTSLTQLKYTVTEAREWTSLLKRQSDWFGGDGIFTIPLDGMEHQTGASKGKILFLFSDSMIGKIKDGKLMPGPVMIHNSVAILKGNKADKAKIGFHWDTDSHGKPQSVFVPKTARTLPGDYFWLGDGFVNRGVDNALYIFGYRIKNVSKAAFGFKEVGNVLIKIPAGASPPYRSQEQKDTPFYIDDKGEGSGSFGAGIYVNTKTAGAPAPDGYIYVYGVATKWKNVLVARVSPTDFEHFDKWSFWDGQAWTRDVSRAQKVADWVSNELSVSPLPDGRYAMVFQIGGMTNEIGLRIGKTPYGPFGPAIKIWDCGKDLTNKNYFVYNAKAHPSLSKTGELIISYNINSTKFFKDLPSDPNMYRPRFIRLKF